MDREEHVIALPTIEFEVPLLLLLLPLPALVLLLMSKAPEGRSGAIRVPFFAELGRLPGGGSVRGRRRGGAVLVLKAFAWTLLVVAAARPIWLGPPEPVTTQGRDLMLALDLSGSMETADFEVSGRAIDRLSVVRAVAQDFVAHREGDRVGLVLFGSRAYLQAPLTFDRDTVVEMLGEGEIGLAGEETAIGDAIGLAVKYLRDRPADERVLVLLSDGASNAGALEPMRAAEIAAQAGVKIYTIGIGSDRAVVNTPFGPRQVAASADLDERTLSDIANHTGGLYFRARDTNALVEIYQRIDALEPSDGEAETVRPTRALFHWPLAGALATAGMLGLAGGIRDTARSFAGQPIRTEA
jgi:Ca-activated chloride channel family protein